ncbi:MAG: ribosomal RNA small subunit methyltransferase A [Deltaproteobacteria bacterium]|nr:ribosomal RNA small subunit methyltransferase A [Deltaproteobacteria bacterium]
MRPLNRRQRFAQKKSLGQVFLREDWPCQKLADLLERAGVHSVLEIGPGPGILTKVLLSRGFLVTAVEKDDRLAERLREQQSSLSPEGRLEIVGQDILKFDLKDWISKQPNQKLAVCGNVPYNISSPILLWLLPHMRELQLAGIMVQLEFGQRVAAGPGSKAYGSLSVFSQLRADVRLEYMVPRACFTPVPKVDSAVISFRAPRNTYAPELLKQVELLTRRSFSQRRKKLSNSLAHLLQDLAPEQIPLDLNRRCETVSPAEFLTLAQRLGEAGSS